MLRKTITYNDLDGNPISEDFYFHLTKAELVEMTMAKQDFEAYIRRIIAAKDGASIMKEFKRIIGMSVGRRSVDGRHFVKNSEIRDEFMSSEAYSELFMELVTDAKAGVDFIKGLLPSGMKTEVDAKVVQLNAPSPFDEDPKIVENTPAWLREDRDPTKAELMAMSQDEIRFAFSRRFNKRAPSLDNRPVWVRENRTPTDEEIKSMTPEQLMDEIHRTRNER